MGHRQPDRRQYLGQEGQPLPVAPPLLDHVGVVVEGGHRPGLDRAGDHETGVAADVGQIADQVGVAGEEAGPHPGQVGPLGQRVDGHHAVHARPASTVGGGPSQVNSA